MKQAYIYSILLACSGQACSDGNTNAEVKVCDFEVSSMIELGSPNIIDIDYSAISRSVIAITDDGINSVITIEADNSAMFVHAFYEESVYDDNNDKAVAWQPNATRIAVGRTGTPSNIVTRRVDLENAKVEKERWSNASPTTAVDWTFDGQFAVAGGITSEGLNWSGLYLLKPGPTRGVLVDAELTINESIFALKCSPTEFLILAAGEFSTSIFGIDDQGQLEHHYSEQLTREVKRNNGLSTFRKAVNPVLTWSPDGKEAIYASAEIDRNDTAVDQVSLLRIENKKFSVIQNRTSVTWKPQTADWNKENNIVAIASSDPAAIFLLNPSTLNPIATLNLEEPPSAAYWLGQNNDLIVSSGNQLMILKPGCLSDPAQ